MSKRSTTTRTRAATRTTQRRREATQQTIAWRSAVQQVHREGTPAQIDARLSDRRAAGEITSSLDEYEKDEEDRENETAMDADIDLSDEDENRAEDCDDSPQVFVGFPRRPGERLFTDQHPLGQEFEFQLRVHEGKCFLIRPRWGGGEASQQAGEDDFCDLGMRLAVLQAVGEWLERERKQFLARPEPLALGVNALREMELGLPSVSPATFLSLSGIGELIIALAGKDFKPKTLETFFSRQMHACHLHWADGSGSLSLGFLFSNEARKAWVASAVLQAARKSNLTLTKAELEGYKNITVPRKADERRRVFGMGVTSLSFPDFIRRANRIAQTKWSEVIDDYLLHQLAS